MEDDGFEVAEPDEVPAPAAPVPAATHASAEDAALEACRRKAENDPLLKLFFSTSPLSFVDASSLKRCDLTSDELFSKKQHLGFKAPARSGKTPAITFSMLRDMLQRRAVLLFTCQPSNNSYVKATDALRDQLYATLGVPSTVEFFTVKDLRERRERVLAAFQTGRRVVLCLRFDIAHIKLFSPPGKEPFKLPPDTAVYMDEPQNKMTFKTIVDEADAEEVRFAKQAVDGFYALGVDRCLMRAVSATLIDSPYWLQQLCGEGAAFTMLTEDIDKLKARRFEQLCDNYTFTAMDNDKPYFSKKYKYGLCVTGTNRTSMEDWHPTIRSVYKVFHIPPPSLFYGYAVMEAGGCSSSPSVALSRLPRQNLSPLLLSSFAGMTAVNTDEGIINRAEVFARAAPKGIHILDSGETEVVHCVYDAVTDTVARYQYVGLPLSMVRADIILRHGYPMNTPCGVYSTRMMQGGEDVVMPLSTFEAWIRPGAQEGVDHVELNIRGPRQDIIQRKLKFGEWMWGEVATAHNGVRRGYFRLARRDGRVYAVVKEYDYERAAEEGFHLDQVEEPREIGYQLDFSAGSVAARAAVLLGPLTDILLWASQSRNIQDLLQALERCNTHNTCLTALPKARIVALFQSFLRVLNHGLAQQQVFDQGAAYNTEEAEYFGDFDVPVLYTDGSKKVRRAPGPHNLLTKAPVCHMADRKVFRAELSRAQEVVNTQPVDLKSPEDKCSSGAGSDAAAAGSSAGAAAGGVPATPQPKEVPKRKPRDDRITLLNEDLAVKHPDLRDKYGVYSSSFAYNVRRHLPTDYDALPVVNRLVFIELEEGADVTAAVLAKQAQLLKVPVADLTAGGWSVQKVTTGTLQASGSTHPGNWSLEAQRGSNRALLYHEVSSRGDGARGVLSILLTRPMKKAAPLCPPPYIFMKFRALEEGEGREVRAVGVDICRVDAVAAAAPPPAGGVSAMELLRMVCRDPRSRGFEGSYKAFTLKAKELFPTEFAAAVKRREHKKNPGAIFFQSKFNELTVPLKRKDGEEERPALLQARHEADGNRMVTVWKVL